MRSGFASDRARAIAHLYPSTTKRRIYLSSNQPVQVSCRSCFSRVSPDSMLNRLAVETCGLGRSAVPQGRPVTSGAQNPKFFVRPKSCRAQKNCFKRIMKTILFAPENVFCTPHLKICLRACLQLVMYARNVIMKTGTRELFLLKRLYSS